MLVEQGNVTALLERVEQVGEPVKFGTNSGDKTPWCGREYGEKPRKKGWSGGFLIWTIRSPTKRERFGFVEWVVLTTQLPTRSFFVYEYSSTRVTEDCHTTCSCTTCSTPSPSPLRWLDFLVEGSFHVLKSLKSLVDFLQQSWLHKTGRQESNQPGWLPVSPEELDGDVWDYAIRCLARLDLQRAWQQVLQGPSIQGGKVWGTNWVFSTGKEDFSIECLILHYSFSWMVIDSSMGTCARYLFLPCPGIEVLPNQDIAAASKGLTSEGNRDREINLHAVSLLFGCLFAVFFEGWNSHSKSWEQHLKYLNLTSCVQTRSRSKGRAFCEDLNEDEVIGTLKDDLMEVPQMP